MKNHNQDGAANALLLPLIVAILLLIGAASFGYWAYGSRQDYKNNTDEKIAAAVSSAKQQESSLKDQQFAEAEKNPLKTYNGPQQYGSMSIQYPKTWSAYVDATGSGQSSFDAYFQPDTVPAIEDETNNYALRVQVLGQSYSDTLNSFSSQTGITVSPYSLPKVSKVIGVKVTGQIADNKSGEMIVLPLRGSTLEIYTEAQQYESDFNNTILPNFSFLP